MEDLSLQIETVESKHQTLKATLKKLKPTTTTNNFNNTTNNTTNSTSKTHMHTNSKKQNQARVIQNNVEKYQSRILTISRTAASVALHRFYSKRAPEKTVTVEAMLDMYEGREHTLLQILGKELEKILTSKRQNIYFFNFSKNTDNTLKNYFFSSFSFLFIYFLF